MEEEVHEGVEKKIWAGGQDDEQVIIIYSNLLCEEEKITAIRDWDSGSS